MRLGTYRLRRRILGWVTPDPAGWRAPRGIRTDSVHHGVVPCWTSSMTAALAMW